MIRSTRPSACHFGLCVGALVLALTAVAAGQTFVEFVLPSSSDPISIVAGPDGALWFTEGSNKIGRITTGGTITEFVVPTPSVPSGIAAGADGALWFTELGSAVNKIGRITTSGSITEFAIPTADSFTELGANKIGRITTAGVITEFAIPTPDSMPLGITIGPDGALWFTESAYSANKIGRITPSGTITEFVVPTARSGPTGITLGPDSNLWFTELLNKIGRFDPSPGQPPPAVPALSFRMLVLLGLALAAAGVAFLLRGNSPG